MSLLANVNQPNERGYYFALDTTPGTAVVDAQAFVATGGSEAGPAGSFTAEGDAVPGGLAMFRIARPSGAVTWAIGLDGTAPFDTSGGNNLAFYAYDNSGGFLSAPMTIQRNIGEVQIGNLNAGTLLVPGTTSTTTLNVTTGGVTVGTTPMAGGGVINLLGTAGSSRVFDPTYNPPVIGSDSLMYSQGADGTVAVDVGFLPAVTGTYVLSATVRGAGSGWSWAAGNSLNYALTYNGGANVVAGAQIYIAGLVDPTGMGARGPLPADSFEYQIDILVSLDAGTSYDIVRGSTGGAYNMGAGSGVAITVAFLTA
jgi:hypothetical protein